ncbi:P-loop containing nucleoside triphosphate hydrolase protein [Cercophora newfieldiana]|uniref:P-loop containing nucleoside triphosphate hydrolase protein n=1 Tax=Cercophora newfieldiana TaxID=92897 RepID=A0AA39XX73_9PEZI|nr:P-loop containing nucleoside triphosphate hydrolase protein [Cercophora newfieldiana]
MQKCLRRIYSTGGGALPRVGCFLSSFPPRHPPCLASTRPTRTPHRTMSGYVATGDSPLPHTPKLHRFFRRSKKPKPNAEHIGRSNSIQTFFEASGSTDPDARWVEYAPPSLPQAKMIKREGAALQVYKRRRRESLGHDGFYIYKVRIQSPFLRDALRDTLEIYGVTYDEHELYAQSYRPHRGLFFALDKVAELARTADSEITRNHCELLRSIIEDIFNDTFDRLEALEKEGKITFDLLWTLFPQRSIYVLQPQNSPPRGYRVESITQDSEEMCLTSEGIVFDGLRYGTVLYQTDVNFFEGSVDYADIPGLPYIDLDRRDDLRARLLKRARRALNMQTIAYMKTRGSGQANRAWLGAQDQEKVIIDPYLKGERSGTYKITPLPGYKIKDEVETETDEDEVEVERRRLDDTHGNDVSRLRYKPQAQQPNSGSSRNGAVREQRRRPTESEVDLNRRLVLESEENLLIMTDKVYGYSIDECTWGAFQVDDLITVQADKSVFEKVVLDEKKKDILKTLVESHRESPHRYDDLIPGKGQCLLVILSGPPGTGKNLVVESLSEYLGCPLLRADPTSIQPDIFVHGYDATLAQFLKDAMEWGSLVLFDEPDFLFQNQEHSTDRADLLAFLRQAEYFNGKSPLEITISGVTPFDETHAHLSDKLLISGIIFLTTNLGRTIDPAVLSRAQIHITFPSLTEDLRIRVWQNFVDRLPEDVGSLSSEDIAQLATWRVNGREIKNILNMAVSWYRKKGEFSVESIETLIENICPSAKKGEDVTHSTSDNVEEEGVDLLDL